MKELYVLLAILQEIDFFLDKENSIKTQINGKQKVLHLVDLVEV